MSISIIIPVLNEEAAINGAIAHLAAAHGEWEIIVVDGSPDGRTIASITDQTVKRLQSGRGRARQMNAGAREARGDMLLFLHADTELPPAAAMMVESFLTDRRFVGGAFDLEIAEKGLAFRVIERVASLRSRLTRIPYGDQAIFLRRDYFQGIGGYRDIPIMEDVELMRRIRKEGDRICFIGNRARTSGRRWRKEGIVRCTLRNWTIMLRYLLGASPESLARKYPDYAGEPSS